MGARGLSSGEVGRALQAAFGDPIKAAGILGVHRATVYRKIASDPVLQVLKKRLEIRRLTNGQ